MCGYVYNPQIVPAKLSVPHCGFNCCLSPIESFEQIYCEKHRGEIVTRAAVRNLERQKKYRRKGEQLDEMVRHINPLRMTLNR